MTLPLSRVVFLSTIVCLLAGASAGRAADTAPAPKDDAGFHSIFNGKDLTGWDGEPGIWSVVDGAIVGESTKQKPAKTNTFLVWRDGGDVDDFELHCMFRVQGNSGIQFRSEEFSKYHIKGYQADMESGDTWSGAQYEEKGRGLLAARGEKVEIAADGKRTATKIADTKALQGFIKKWPEWNRYDLVVQGNHIVQKINGHVTAEVIDNDTKHARRTGVLALQVHANTYPMRAEFKDVAIKRLKLAEGKKVVLIAGPPSHGWGAHEFNAGSILLKKRLNKVPGVLAVSYHNGWPRDPSALDNADAVVLYMDGGGGHPVIKHLEALQEVARRGGGIMCMHYAVEVPAGVVGNHFKDWIGGYYETGYSINPHWKAETVLESGNPITRGVKPFTIGDEWYFNMRFRDDVAGIHNVLQAKPDDAARSGATTWPRGPKNHILANKGRIETLMWAIERPDGGRGVGFTGGHVHDNWSNDDYRKLVLNALVWVAGAEVPTDGVASESVSREELDANQDEPKPKNAK